MPKENYLVIIGDIIKSREITNRKTFQEHFESQFKHKEIFKKNDIVSPFTVTIGDEFQGILGGAGYLFQIINKFEYGLNFVLTDNQSIENMELTRQSYNLRYGFGIGEITTKINKEAAIGMDGPAFYNARESLEKAKKENFKYCFKSSPQKDEVVNNMLQWLGYETRKWSYQKFQIIKLHKDGWTQKQIAESLRISQPAVSKALKAAPVRLTTQTENIIEQQINSIMIKDQMTTYSMVAEPSSKYNSKPR